MRGRSEAQIVSHERYKLPLGRFHISSVEHDGCIRVGMPTTVRGRSEEHSIQINASRFRHEYRGGLFQEDL
ncbi:hypothetical protein J2S73_002096 [Amorphus orientalis]|uniref:Uncharacterized protein n=1 Tax=Amorphus orientalis TaxID=649198 RepID=A0AAE3VN67_9HYPH|nr:hypothetical protein [Amorphus orientalis]